ncbi:hypothetical protein Tco_1099675, partial [Tanacetum coccineum]
RDTIQLETTISTISQEYLLEFTSEYGISEELHPELPGPEERIVDFLEGKVGVYTKFFEFANFRIPISQFLFDILGHYQIHLSQLSVIGAAKVSHFEINYMDLFNLISAPNPTKVKTGIRPRATCEVLLLTVTASRVIDMEDPVATSTSLETPSVMEKSPLDFSNEDLPPLITNKGETEDQALAVVSQEVPTTKDTARAGVSPELDLEKETAAMGPPDTRGGKSINAMGLGPEPPSHTSARQGVSDPDPLSYAEPSSKKAPVTADPDSENTSFTSMAGSPGSIYQPGWGVTNGCRLDTPDACQDLVDHLAPPGYFSELRHLPNEDFLSQYNINLARQVAMGSQLRLRFEQEAKLLKKSVAQVARRDQRTQARENEIKNLETLLEAEADMKKAAEAKNAELVKELENLRA